MRRTGRLDVVRGGVALAVIAAGVVVSVTRGSGPVEHAATLLIDPRGTTVVSASGSSRPAVSGETITAGEVVTTGPHGYAELSTRGRDVLLSANAAVEVVDGGHQQLRHGTAVISALHGPGLLLDLAGDTVTIPAGSATEAARGVSVRVGTLAGPAAITNTTGRRLAVPRLSQAVLSGDALPSAPTPLHLTDSQNEAAVVSRLVADDLALKTLARGIDTTGRSTAHVIEASWSGTRQPVPDEHSRSERVLPVLIADATHVGTVQQRYDDAVAWRAEGGSWGVVLHLLDGRATAVESTLASLQHSRQRPGQIGTVLTTTVGTVTAGPPATSITAPPVIGGKTTFPSSPSIPSSPSTPGTGVPPTQPPNLLGGLVETVQSVIDGVFNLLPHDATTAAATPATTPSKSAKASKAATAPKSASAADATSAGTSKRTKHTPEATPTPTPSSNGLLGNLLGGLLGQQ